MKPLLAGYRVTDSEHVHGNVVVYLRSQRSLQHAEHKKESEKKIGQKTTDSKVDQYKNLLNNGDRLAVYDKVLVTVLYSLHALDRLLPK